MTGRVPGLPATACARIVSFRGVVSQPLGSCIQGRHGDALPRPSGRRAARARDAPAFSVLIAVHNAADVIAEAIESALQADLPAARIIVCDDGSTDALDAALEPYRDRIVLLRKEQGGEASAKNAAARAASGEFVVILDADDVFLPTRLEALADAGRRPARPRHPHDGRDPHRRRPGGSAAVTADGWTFEVQDQRREILRRNFVFGLAAVRRELCSVDGAARRRTAACPKMKFRLRISSRWSWTGKVQPPLVAATHGPGRRL